MINPSSILVMAESTSTQSTTSIIIATLMGGGGVALIGALAKGWTDLKKLKMSEGKIRVESDKALQEAAGSVVQILKQELESQTARFDRRVKKLEDENEELSAKTRSLEKEREEAHLLLTTQQEENQRRDMAFRRWARHVEEILKKNNLTAPSLDEYIGGSL